MKQVVLLHRNALLASLMASAFALAACGGSDTPEPVEPAPAPVPPLSARLTWTASAGAQDGYRVYYGTASGLYGQALGSGTIVNGTSFTVTGLTSGSTYFFAVTAVRSDGSETDFSNEASKQIQ